MTSASRHIALLLLLLLGALVLAACGGEDDGGSSSSSDSGSGADTEAATTPAGSGGAPKLRLVEVGRFEAPVHALAVPGTDLVAIVEKGGRVRVVANLACVGVDRCPAKPATTGDVIVDLRDEVSDGSEQGLLGMAFHPSWPDDPRIFLNYTDAEGATRIEAWELTTPTGRATRTRELLRIEQPYENHNGGHLAFGPDGLLYIGTGDGGSGGDPEDRAQKDDDLLGKLLRLDVDGGGERGYAIPDGNVDDGAPEAWAIGLRNPWRFSFDSETGDLWIGDVGQSEFEEIDALTKAQLGDGSTRTSGGDCARATRRSTTAGRPGPASGWTRCSPTAATRDAR